MTVTLLISLASCASKKEKEERRENAFNLSGNYVASIRAGSEINMNIDIQNENGRHDIYVKLERSSNLTKKEIALLQKHGISLSQAENNFLPQMVLGRNSDRNGHIVYNLNGGENISDDSGASSKFFVCTPSIEVSGHPQEGSKKTRYHIYYCLSGNVKKSDYRLSGALDLHVRKEFDEARSVPDQSLNEEKRQVISYENVSHAYQTDAFSVFYKQLKGRWSGKVYNAHGLNADLGIMKGLIISFENKDEYYLGPDQNGTIHLDGEEFEYKKTLSKADDLRNAPVPLVEMHFINKNNKNRIILIGQIFSLGRFTGSIILFNQNNPEEIQLASFEYTKD